MHGKSTEALVETLYCELREIAATIMRNERVGHALQTTALVHEVYLKLSQEHLADGWSSRSQFLSAASEAMRRILVDHARARMSRKRGGSFQQHPLADVPLALPLPPEDLLAIHDCLDQFAEQDPVKAELVKLRVFGGLNHVEAAEVLNLPRSTADRYWAFAKARLMSMLDGD